MRWYRVLGPQLVSDVRWLRLSMAERGAWITLANLAAGKEPPGVLASEEEAELLLQREGGDEAAATVARLLAVGMLEIEGAGEIGFGVGIDWTARPPSAEPERVRDRVARHRERQSGNDSASLRNDRQTDKTERKRETTHAPASRDNGASLEEAVRLLQDPSTAEPVRRAAEKAVERQSPERLAEIMERVRRASPAPEPETPGAE